MTAWPPPVDSSTVRAEKPVRVDGDWRVLELREVALWADRVWFDDESGRVWCPGCKELVDLEVIGRPVTNVHHVGLHVRNGQAVRLLPMGDDADDPSSPRSPDFWDRVW